jgi:hypothetical protein
MELISPKLNQALHLSPYRCALSAHFTAEGKIDRVREYWDVATLTRQFGIESLRSRSAVQGEFVWMMPVLAAGRDTGHAFALAGWAVFCALLVGWSLAIGWLVFRIRRWRERRASVRV